MKKESRPSDDGVFEGSVDALLKRFAGGVICMSGLTFLIVGIIMKGVRWDFHWALAILTLFCSLFLLFLLEGTQIAVVRLNEGGHIPPEVYAKAPEVATLLESMGAYGVANYLIGRQVLVCANVYLVAALTELGDPLVSRAITILAGIFTVVCFGQLIPQLAADISPILFCRIPGVRQVILLSSFLSKLGVGHFSYWIGVIMLDFLKDTTKPETKDSKSETQGVTLVSSDGGESRPKMETLSREILDALICPTSLDVKSENHIPPHILLAISQGLRNKDTAPTAEALLNETLSTVTDAKKRELVVSFVRDQTQEACV